MDATNFYNREFHYEIRNGQEVIIGQFMITKKKKNDREDTHSFITLAEAFTCALKIRLPKQN
jgi:hypothetical protein